MAVHIPLVLLLLVQLLLAHVTVIIKMLFVVVLVFITEEDILKATKKLKNTFTAGLDGISNQDCSVVFSKPLYIVFNLILKTSK